MRVLNIVTNEQSRFFKQQVTTLEELGVEQTTLSVSSNRINDDGTVASRSFLEYAGLVPRVVRRSLDDYDLVHANYGLTAPAALAQVHLPVVISLWGTDLMGRFGRLSRACAQRADAVIVMSPEMADILDMDCYVIPHGVDTTLFAPRPQHEARAELGWDEDTRYVLFPYPPGRDVKDYPRAERVVAEAAEAFDEPVEIATISKLPHDQMPTYYNAVDLLLLTSKREGSPNAIKEALACNTPVVSTDVGDVRTRVDGVTNAYVCQTDAELVDGITSILRDGGRSDGRTAIEECSLTRMGERIIEVYQSVTDTAESPPPVIHR
jgi:glycosyltransferase involved in cell wall biosynthesis